MKILLLGDAGNYHSSLAHGLRKLGHDVTLASDTSMPTRNIDLSHGNGRIARSIFLARLATTMASRLKGYDIVQIASPDFINISASNRMALLKKLKKNNGSVYMTALKADSAIISNLCGPEPALEYSRWRNPKGLRPWAKNPDAGMAAWLNPELQQYTRDIYHSVDGVVSGRYEYHKVIESIFPEIPLAYGGIPVIAEAYGKPKTSNFKDRYSFLITSVKNNDDERGLHIFSTMLQMAEAHTRSKFRRVMVPPMPFDDFITEMRRCEMVCEDIYSHSPGSVALAAMTMGVVPVCGGEDGFYKFIGEDKLRPVFNPVPDHVKNNFRDFAELLADPERLARMSAEGPEFVHRHNDSEIVAKRFVDFWQR